MVVYSFKPVFSGFFRMKRALNRLFLLGVLGVVIALPQLVYAQNSGGETKSFRANVRVVDANSMLSNKTKIMLWGARKVEGAPVLVNETGRIALDEAVGASAVTCELKGRTSEHLIAQCDNAQGLDLGLSLLQQGFLDVDRSQVFDTIYEDPYLAAQRSAQANQIGIWLAEGSSSHNGEGGSSAFTVLMFIIVLLVQVGVFVIIYRSLDKIGRAQELSKEMLGRERKIKDKERAVVINMLGSEIKGNKSKIEAYIVVYDEMLADMKNPQRQPKYKKAGDIVQKQPSLDRAVFERNTDKLGVLGDELASQVIHFYARIKTDPDYTNLDPATPLDDAIMMVEKGLNSARRMERAADDLVDAFTNTGEASPVHDDAGSEA